MRAREAAGRAALLVGAVILTLVFLELGCRLVRGPYWLLHWPNLVWAERAQTLAAERNDPYVYDPALGWTLKANYVSRDFNVDPDGYRRVPPPPPGTVVDAPPILALGGSHTEGAEVADGETWPAGLQRLVGRRTINAGVSGYGLDQILLQAERIVPALHPQAVVMVISGENVLDLGFRRVDYVGKPYFDLVDGALALRNTPVPPPCGTLESLPVPQRLFGWSMLAETIAGERYRDQWFGHLSRAPSRVSIDELSCAVMRRFARLPVRVLVVADVDRESSERPVQHGAEQRRESTLALRCAMEAGLPTLDLYDLLRQAIEARGLDVLYRAYHHSPEGQHLVATAIAEALEKRPAP